MPTISDYLFQAPSGSTQPVVNQWVRLVNNTTSTAYVSTAATTTAGFFTVNSVPAGAYTVSTGPTSTGAWTATGNANYEVAIVGGPSGGGDPIVATANYGTLSLGAAAFDGVTTGKFVGSASGTVLAVNAASGFTGNLFDFQTAGATKAWLSAAGGLTVVQITSSDFFMAGTRFVGNSSGDINLDAIGATGTVRFRTNNGGTTIGSIASTGIFTAVGAVMTVASATAAAGLNVPHGAAPTSPVNGDIWTTTAGLFVRVNGVTKTVTLT